MKKFTYYLLYGFVYLLSLLPFWLLYLLSDLMFLLVFFVFRYRRKIVWKNLTTSFPQKGEQELRQVERRFYRWFCDMMLETFKLLSISNEKLLRHLEFRNAEQMEQVFDEGRDLAVMMGHYGNWEWMSAIGLCFKRYPQAVMGLIYPPLRNDQADWLSVAIRSAHGGICVNKRHVLRHLLQYKRQGKRSLFGYISDQAPKWENIHLWLDFLGHDTPVFTGGERIMSKMDDGVFYLDLSRPRRGYYVVEFKLISQHAAQEEENAITHRFFQMLEDSIRRNPAYYLWTHDRWKRTREEFNELFINVNGHNILKDQQKTTEG
jgi:KDO2-lipid IV(A) lauroyltransferase